MKTGRPTIYSEKLADQICELVSERSLISVLRENPDLPGRTAVYDWLATYPEFANKYAIACQNRADFNADEIDDIAHEVLKGRYDPAAARVALDALKWAASKLKPKKYGERLQHANDEENPMQMILYCPKEETDSD